MVDPDVYNAGRNSSETEKFDWYVREICDLLEDLWSTEGVWNRFEQLENWYVENTANMAIIHKHDSTAETLSDYPFNADWINDYTAMTDDLHIDQEIRAADEIKDCFDVSYALDHGTIKRYCELVLKPNPVQLSVQAHAMATAADELHTLTSGLDTNDAESMPGFVRNLEKNGWSAGSLSSDSFFDFYGDLSDLTGNYAEAAFHLATTTAAASALITKYQKLVNKIGLETREQVIGALKYWQANKAPYNVTVTRTSKDNLVTQVTDVVQTATDWIGLIPGAGVVTDPVGKVSMILGFAAQEWEISVSTTEAPAASAIYEDFVGALAKAQEGLLQNLDTLQSRDVYAGGSFEKYVTEAEGNGSWNPPQVEF
mgnify:CR=1 FL=1